MELAAAFVKLGADRGLADRFVQDPQGVLTSLDVDTSKLKIRAGVDANSRRPLDAVLELSTPRPEPQPLVVTICVTIGGVISVSVGSDIDTKDLVSALTSAVDQANP